MTFTRDVRGDRTEAPRTVSSFDWMTRRAVIRTHTVSRMDELKCATCTGQQKDSSVTKYGFTPKNVAVLARRDVYQCTEGHFTTEDGKPVEFDDVVKGA